MEITITRMVMVVMARVDMIGVMDVEVDGEAVAADMVVEEEAMAVVGADGGAAEGDGEKCVAGSRRFEAEYRACGLNSSLSLSSDLITSCRWRLWLPDDAHLTELPEGQKTMHYVRLFSILRYVRFVKHGSQPFGKP